MTHSHSCSSQDLVAILQVESHKTINLLFRIRGCEALLEARDILVLANLQISYLKIDRDNSGLSIRAQEYVSPETRNDNMSPNRPHFVDIREDGKSFPGCIS